MKPLNRISWNFVVIQNILCKFAIHQNFWFNIFSWSYAAFEPWNLAKVKYTTETVCQRYSSETLNRILWNIVVDKDILCACAYLQEIYDFIFERTIRTLDKIYYFVQLMWNRFKVNDREAVQSDIFLTVNIQMLHKCENY